jgi:hypothetical protein
LAHCCEISYYTFILISRIWISEKRQFIDVEDCSEDVFKHDWCGLAYMDSKHDTLVRVLNRLEAMQVAVANVGALNVDASSGYSSFHPNFTAMTEYQYKTELNHADSSKSTMVIKKKAAGSPEYTFVYGNLYTNAEYFSDGGLFRYTGVVYPAKFLCTDNEPKDAMGVIESFLHFNSNKEPFSSHMCSIKPRSEEKMNGLILHWSCEYQKITNEVSDLSSNMIFRENRVDSQ